VPFVVAGSGRTLALVPTAHLAPNTTFLVEASDLFDQVGGVITVPPVMTPMGIGGAFCVSSRPSQHGLKPMLAIGTPGGSRRCRASG
jgi:hypothetical protein